MTSEGPIFQSHITLEINMKKIIIVATFILSGCISVPTPTPIMTSATPVSSPDINEKYTAYIGDKMLSQGTQHNLPTIELKEGIEVSYLDVTYWINKGVVFEQYGFDRNTEYYESINEGNSIISDSNYDHMQSNKLSIDKYNKVCVITVNGAAICDDKYKKLKLIRGFTPKFHTNNFQQTLIYNGKIGNQLKIGYREFSGNTARAAFSNEVAYDLSESKFIGYKGALIEILNTTNQLIEYKVIRNFNQ